MENVNLHLCKCQTSVSEKSPLKYLNVFQLRWEKVIEMHRVPQMVQELSYQYNNGNFDSVSLNVKINIKK